MSADRIERISRATQAVDPQVWIVTSRAGDRLGGLVATFVTKASIVPDQPRYIVGIAKQHFTWQLIEESGACALHLITEHHLEWVLRLGIASGHHSGPNKLEDFRHSTLTTGAPILEEAVAAFDCRVEAKLNSGDRSIYLLQVVDATSLPELPTPLRVSQMWNSLLPQQRLQLEELHRRDQEIDRRAIIDWRADSLESQT